MQAMPCGAFSLHPFSALSLLNCLLWAKCCTYWKYRDDKCVPFSQGCLRLAGDIGLCVRNRDLFVFIQQRRWVSPGAQVSITGVAASERGREGCTGFCQAERLL